MAEAGRGLFAAVGQHELLGCAGDRVVSQRALIWRRPGLLIRGDYYIAAPTLNRFFSLHVPRCRCACFPVIAHLMALHEVGSNNPDGSKSKVQDSQGHPLDGVPFHPTTREDLFGVADSCCLFGAVVFFARPSAAFVPGKNRIRPAKCFADTSAHCAGMVFHAGFTRCCARCLVRGPRRSGA